LTSYQAILKKQYLAPIRSSVYAQRVLLDRLVKRVPGKGDAARKRAGGLKAETVRLPQGQGWGQMLSWDVHVGRNWGTGPRAGSHGPTTGYIPQPGSQGYVEAQLLAAHYYGAAQLDGSLIDSTKGVTAAGLRALDSEMKRLPDDIRADINRDLFGDGSGKLANVAGSSSGTTITCDSVRLFTENQPIVVAAADGTAAVARTIASIDRTNKTITVDQATDVTAANDIFPSGIHNTNYASAYNVALSGLAAIISATSTYAALNRTDAAYAGCRSVLALAIAKTAFEIGHMEDMLRDLKHKNGDPSLIVCDHNFYKLFGDIYFGNNQWHANEKTLNGGYPALLFHDIPLVRDDDCPEWTAHWLTEADFELGIERELSLMDEDGVQMVRAHDANGDMDAYKFAFVTRMNLLCGNPGGQGTMTINSAA
jgi:hypothetical protein